MEDEADGVITVSIPVPVLILLCGRAINDKIAAVVPIQTTDDVQERCLP